MNKMPCKIITMFLVVGIVSIHCYPINKEERRSITDSGFSQVIMSNTVRALLININNSNTSEGLAEVSSSAGYFVNDELYMPEVIIANYIRMRAITKAIQCAVSVLAEKSLCGATIYKSFCVLC